MKHYPHSSHNGSLKHGGHIAHKPGVLGHVGHGETTLHTEGRGKWMSVAPSRKMPNEQKPPTESMPIRQRKLLACPE